MWALYAILIVGTVLSTGHLAKGCSCPTGNHPQEFVCKADFVLTGKRQGTFQRPADTQVGLPPSFDIVFNVKVTKAIKIPKLRVKRNDIILVQTAANSASCGVAVLTGEEWLFSGKIDVVNGKVVFKIHLCGWNIETAKLTRQQKRYLRKGRSSYFGKKDQNCKKCNISRCPNNDCSIVRPLPTTCLMDEAHPYSEYYRCEFKKAKKDQPERCEWSISGTY